MDVSRKLGSSEPGGARDLRAAVGSEQIENENDDENDCSKLRAMLEAVGRGSVRTGRRA
jgi:hypothetical protein